MYFIFSYLKKIKNKKQYFVTFIFILFAPIHHFHINKKPEIIIWNVGQGQMVTYSDVTTCIHFDMGGEVFPYKKLAKECGHKKNKVFYSHWDLDHINFTHKAIKQLPFFCRLNTPGGTGNKKKQKFLFKLPKCDRYSIQKTHKIFREIIFSTNLNKTKKHNSSNKHSKVIVVKNTIVIPGDSPGSSERLWQHKIKSPITILVLSHHGSKYSTMPPLLKYMPHLQLAISSARRKRYNHPHPIVKKRLAQRGVPLISTEEYNHIRLPIPVKTHTVLWIQIIEKFKNNLCILLKKKYCYNYTKKT